jgi:predicted MFS family arabinose efflux permease
MGVYQQTVSVGWMIGPAFGGFLSELIGFRNIFLVGAILAAIGFALVLALVKEPRHQPVEAPQKAPSKESVPLELEGRLIS